MTLSDAIQQAPRRIKASVRLDANESPFNSSDNRYPDEEVLSLRQKWGSHERIPAHCIYFCNGTEEAVDFCMRVYALPCRDSVVSVSPTRGIYKRRAMVNRLEYREVVLDDDGFSLNAEKLLDTVSATTKIIFLCSPNNPTGNLLDAEEVEKVVGRFNGMVVVDESYIDYVPQATLLNLLNTNRNLIILRSFSHAWASAGVRLAAVVAHPEVISDFERIGFAHPIGSLVIRYAMQMVARRFDVDKWVRRTIDERTKVMVALKELPECEEVYPSVANFVLVRFTDTQVVYKYLLKQNIAVRPVHGALRITIGLPAENSALLGALRRRNRRP